MSSSESLSISYREYMEEKLMKTTGVIPGTMALGNLWRGGVRGERNIGDNKTCQRS